MTQPNEQTQWQGNHYGVSNAGQYVARTQQEWTQIWDAVQSNRIPAPSAPQMPQGMMAICIFTGQQSGPATISIESMDENRAGAVVNYKIESHSSMLCVMNENYLLQFVPATTADVTFNRVQPQATIKPSDLKKFGPR